MSRATVVMCPPLGREYFSAHYAFRVVAEELAERGITAIRFDYDGTGDSVGSDAEADRLQASLNSVRHAIDLARRLGTTELALVGMRMSALLAARAAEECHQRVAALVLWDPCASGRDFLREQSALFRLRYGKSDLGDGGTEIPGFVLTAQSEGDLASCTAPTSLPRVERALVLTRPDRVPVGTFGVKEDRVDFEPAEGQAELMDVEPFFGKLPPSTHRIAQWLDAALPTDRSLQGAPETRDSMVLADEAGAEVTERLVTLGPHQLFGIETTGPGESRRPVILFLNSGTDSHIGPNRLWVDLSRAWAGSGLRCIRFDLSGLGDSPVRAGQEPHVPRAPEAFDDMADVVAELAGDGDDQVPVVLVGLCAGAYQALESALHLHPRAVVAVNPILRFQPPEWRTGHLDPRRRFCLPAGNLTQAYRTLPSWKIVRLARRGYMFASRLRAKNRSGAHWLKEMAKNGTEVLCVCGEEEAAVFFPGGAMPEGNEIVLGPHSRIDVIEGLDHGLMPARHRLEVTGRLTRHLHELHLDTGGAVAAAANDPLLSAR